MKKHFTLSKTEKLPDSRILIEGEIDVELLNKHREKALKEIGKNAELPGFRRGHVPENMLVERLGEMHILGEASEGALNEVYPQIIESEKVFVIGEPEVKITKLAPQTPVGFSITISVLPEFKLPPYKKIAGEVVSEEIFLVSEKEVDDVINEIRKNFAHMEMHKNKNSDDHKHGEIKDEDLPEVNDEFVKKIGQFKDVSDFREKAKENLTKEKSIRAKEKRRTEILENILKGTEISVPQILIENELKKMLAQFQDDVARAGVNFEEYLKQVNKTEEGIKKDWTETAIKKAKIQLILNKISEEEKISPDGDKVRTETEKILIAHPSADPIRARLYVGQMFLNEKVIEFLESQE